MRILLPMVHLMAVKISFEEYIERQNIKFNNNYDFSNFINFKNGHSKSFIKCKKHNHLFELDIFHHIGQKFGGCEFCVKENRDYNRKPHNRKILLNHIEVLSFLKEKYNCEFYSYDVSDVETVTKGNIKCFCSKHNVTIKRNFHYLKNKYMSTWCNQCANEKRIETKSILYDIVIKQLQNIYDNFYKYPDENRLSYKNQNQKIKIICPLHGEFIKQAGKHKIQGCFRCTIDKLIKDRILSGGYNKDYFDKNPDFKDTIGYIYYVKIDDIYKIGITKNINHRLKCLRYIFKKDIQVIDVLKTTLYDAWVKEDLCLSKYQNVRIYTKESTELFKYDVLNGKIENL